MSLKSSKKPSRSRGRAKTKTGPLQSPKGVFDILPQDQPYWEFIKSTVKKLAGFYGFQRIDTPVIEDTSLFVRTTGETTDIVEKQMYTFKTKGDDSLTLRPENTPGVARAYIEHGMTNLQHPVKLYYFGPMFRHESPQRGRQRQFHQFGFETLGFNDPALDVQIIQLFYNILQALKIKNIIIQINSIGCPSCRPAYRAILIDYYRSHSAKLCADCRKRLKQNPLRLLDCKQEKCVQLKNQAPQILDHLCEECHNHFKNVLEFLDELELPYILNYHLVRGLDYYTKTVFEFFIEKKEKDEDQAIALGGGGRYDNLMETLGGKPTPAVGLAAGVERMIAQMRYNDVKVPSFVLPAKVFLAQLGTLGKKKSLKLFEQFRAAGIPVIESFGRDSVKSQIKIADRLKIRYTLILGQKEAFEGNIILRDMDSGAQETIRLDKIINVMKKRLQKK